MSVLGRGERCLAQGTSAGYLPAEARQPPHIGLTGTSAGQALSGAAMSGSPYGQVVAARAVLWWGTCSTSLPGFWRWPRC
jgi:hypothetical protein